MGEIQPIPADVGADLEKAVAVLWAEFDDAWTLVMALIDMFDVAQQQGQRIEVPKLRGPVSAEMIKAIRARDGVLAPLGIDPPEQGD